MDPPIPYALSERRKAKQRQYNQRAKQNRKEVKIYFGREEILAYQGLLAESHRSDRSMSAVCLDALKHYLIERG